MCLVESLFDELKFFTHMLWFDRILYYSHLQACMKGFHYMKADTHRPERDACFEGSPQEIQSQTFEILMNYNK